MGKDTLFTHPPQQQFEFNESVAAVFDDMLARSVPYYRESLTLSAELITRWVAPEASVVDLGCSTGNLLLLLHKLSGGSLRLTGVDSSEAMIAQAQKKADALGAPIEYRIADVNRCDFRQQQAVCAHLLLQFIRPPKRLELLRRIHGWLEPEGVFCFSEKLTSDHKKLDRLLIERYLDYKRSMGYSDYEIARKREALENVLIPYSAKENEQMALDAGFSHVECIFRWNNFATFWAVK